MRIVISGTHASGKSTLISDFAMGHPEFTVLPDPFELMDESGDAPSASMFASQLRVAADRLIDTTHDSHLIAERGPLDFLAYLIAWAELSGRDLDPEFLSRASERTLAALRTVDLLVLLPLAANDSIHVDVDEYLDLRAGMNDVLMDLVDDRDLVGDHLEVLEVTGNAQKRLAALEAVTDDSRRRHRS